ncbi:dioxygenase family protein, partial [Arthrobacter sp. Hiyo1]|uniref:dioxygenase family protein n=1 Tax=Arthrobacter sp. Hiyo1 TaxID=1588020 RepID=UPI000AF510FC
TRSPPTGPSRTAEAAGRHPYRPAHIHFLVAAPGYRELTTHIFIGGSDYIDSDAVFAVKGSLVKDFTENPDPEDAARYRSKARSGTAASTLSCTPSLRRDRHDIPVFL